MKKQTITIGLLGGNGKLHVLLDGENISFDLSEFVWDAVPYGQAHLNRFGGQGGIYSDAQHAVILSRIVGPDPLLRLAALLHDSGEPLGAGDTNTFLKRALGASRLSVYEDELCEALWQWKKLPGTYKEHTPVLNPIDKAIGTAEAIELGFTVPADAPRLDKQQQATFDGHAVWRSRWQPSEAACIWQMEWDHAEEQVRANP